MYPVLFHLGFFTVTSYTALLDIGLLCGAVMVYLAARRRELDPVQVLDAALVAALGGLIGARAVYVAANWAYYGNHVRQALRLWGGGLAWHGALVGALVAVLVYCAVRRTSPRLALDVLTPGAAVMAVWAWLGCLLAGCAYGLETYPGQGLLWTLSLELFDLYGLWAPRVAVQLLGAGWGAVALAAVVVAGRDVRFEGLVFPLWLALYAIGSCGLGFVRADQVPLVAGWRADQVADLALTLIGATMFTVGLFRKRRVRRIANPPYNA